jgi:hypothetical protein
VLNTLNELTALRNYSTTPLNSSTWTAIFAVNCGNHGFIKVNTQTGGTGVYSMATAFFEKADRSNTSLTLIAQSGNAAQGTLNTTNASTGGTVQITLQRSGNNIQARSVPSALPVAVRVTLL